MCAPLYNLSSMYIQQYEDNWFGKSEILYFIIPLVLFALLDVVLRGVSLWKSAQRKQKVWFIALLLVNSVGVLPAIYLYLNRKVAKDAKKSSKKK